MFTFSEAVTISNDINPADFVVSGAASKPTVTSFNKPAPSVVVFTLSDDIAPGETITLSYTKGTGSITSVLGGDLASFAHLAVDNIVGDTPPTVSSTATNLAGNAITVTFSEAVTITGTPVDSFTVNAASRTIRVTGVKLSGQVLTLTLADSVTSGERVTLAYNKSTSSIKDATGNLLSSFGNKRVTVPNTIVPAPTITDITTDQTSADNNKICVVFSRDITISRDVNPTDFVVSGVASNPTVTSVGRCLGITRIPGRRLLLRYTVLLVLSDDGLPGESIILSYVQTTGSITGTSGSPIADFFDRTVTNALINSPAGLTVASTADQSQTLTGVADVDGLSAVPDQSLAGDDISTSTSTFLITLEHLGESISVQLPSIGASAAFAAVPITLDTTAPARPVTSTQAQTVNTASLTVRDCAKTSLGYAGGKPNPLNPPDKGDFPLNSPLIRGARGVKNDERWVSCTVS